MRRRCSGGVQCSCLSGRVQLANAATAAGFCGVQCSGRSCLLGRARWGMRPLLRPMRCQCSCCSCLLGRVRWSNGATAATHACISDRPCAPADCEPEADVLDRHAKGRSETSKLTSAQNTSCSLLGRWGPNGSGTVRKWFVNGSQMVSEWFANGSHMVRKWFAHGSGSAGMASGKAMSSGAKGGASGGTECITNTPHCIYFWFHLFLE